jgi:hypothetical protein
MKFTAFVLAGLIFFTGCSKTTAFDFFKMNPNYERAISNLQAGTIARSFETEVILSSVYLNAVYPDDYKDGEYFFIALYIADDKRLFYIKANMSDPDYQLMLNGVNFIDAQELKEDDKLRSLMPINNEWNRYYLIKFDTQHRDDLMLSLENKNLDKIKLHYQKEGSIAKKQ